MLSNMPFVFTSAATVASKFDTAMPCCECSMLGYGITCQDCSRFRASSPMTPPSSPVSVHPFSFDFTLPLRTSLAALGTPFTPATKQSRWNWPKSDTSDLEAPSTKKSRFSWPEMSNPTEQYALVDSSTYFSDAQIPSSDTYSNLRSTCPVCSMVPYGALCTKCGQIQTSKAIILATPPAVAWPVLDKLGDWEGTKVQEEELLQNLDKELFEQINVPHEVDEWGRRVYNDCGHRILYYKDAEGNTVMGYVAWYASSVVDDDNDDDDDEPDGWRADGQMHDSAADMKPQDGEPDDGGDLIPRSARSDGEKMNDGCEAWDPISVIGDYEEPEREQDDVIMLYFEQQRFAEFLAVQDDKLPQFESDRERIAAWIATSAVIDGDDVQPSVSNYEKYQMVSPMVY